MKSTPLESRIAEMARPVAADLGLDIVRVSIIGEKGGRNVQVMAEDPKTRKLGLEDCAKLSKALSALLDVEDPIEGTYRLEVSSPGIDRPLVRIEDFIAYAGFEARLETDLPSENGQKRFKGVLKGVKDEQILLDTELGPIEIPFRSLNKARLVMSDALIKATAGN